MKISITALQLTVALYAAAASAPAKDRGHSVNVNAGLFSQYVFRGLAQTNEGPALQGAFDYSYNSDSASFYAGVWGSNLSWLRDSGLYIDSSLELDFYGGIRGGFGRTPLTWDVGYLFYWYPGDLAPLAPNANSQEVYGALGWYWISGRVSCSLSDKIFAVRDSRGTFYFDLTANPPLGKAGLSLVAHYGYQRFRGTDPALAGRADNTAYFSYGDWKAGLNFDAGKVSSKLSGISAGAFYAGTHGADPCGYGSTTEACSFGGSGSYPQNIAEGKLVVYLQFSR